MTDKELNLKIIRLHTELTYMCPTSPDYASKDKEFEHYCEVLTSRENKTSEPKMPGQYGGFFRTTTDMLSPWAMQGFVSAAASVIAIQNSEKNRQRAKKFTIAIADQQIQLNNIEAQRANFEEEK